METNTQGLDDTLLIVRGPQENKAWSVSWLNLAFQHVIFFFQNMEDLTNLFPILDHLSINCLLSFGVLPIQKAAVNQILR